MIKASAPAKIHLIGEYSAIFGKPTILFPVNLRLTVSIEKAKTNSSLLNKSGKFTKQETKNVRLAKKAIEKAIEKKFNKKIPEYSLKVDGNIPYGSGLGSSSAISASLTKALLKLLNVKATKNEVFRIAVEGEKVFHGFPSGSDLWTVIIGKPLWYRKESDNFLIVKPLDFKIHKNIRLFLIDSGKPHETTKQMVKSFKKINPTSLKEFLNSQEELTKNMLPVLKNGNKKEFTNILQKANHNLEKLGVVSKKAQEIIRKIEAIGGSAKITGAGGKKSGSGQLITYHNDPKKLKALASKNSWHIIPIQ